MAPETKLRAPLGSSVGVALALVTTACGGTTAPPAPTSLALAPAYEALVVSKILPDGIEVARLDVAPLRLFDLQSAGGQVVGSAQGVGAAHAVEGTFESDTGRFRFDAFPGPLVSAQAEQVEALGGRGDDDVPADGLANTITGYVRTSSGTTYQTDGSYIGVAEADDLPTLDVTLATATEFEVGRVRVTGAAGFAPARAAVEVFVYRLRADQPDFAVVETQADGSMGPLVVDAVPGDVVLVRALVLRRLGPAVALRVQ